MQILLTVLFSAACLHVPEVGERSVTTVETKGENRVEICFEVPISDIQQLWTPDMQVPFQERKWWVSKASSPQHSMPCIAYFNTAEQNVLFFGSESLEWDNRLESKVNQERGVYEVKLTVAAGDGTLRPFKVTIDRRPVAWTQAVGDWRDGLAYGRGRYPDGAWKPVYCSWYAAHAAISAEWTERMATIAADLGFGTFILDDGWSYDEAKRVNPTAIKNWYRDVGKWDVFSKAKFPDFKAHRERMRRSGLNYIVWVAPYFVGTRSEAYRRWGYGKDAKVVEGNTLTDIANAAQMESVTEQLVRLLKDADLDGLKIDFLDSIDSSVEHPLGARKHAYVTDLMNRLRAVRPDGVFEFRQAYATPINANLATQFRAGDVPFEWLANLMRIAQIRLTMGDGAPVHADPIYWSDAETNANVDRHFMAAMAGVPMLSMDLERLSPERRGTIRKWMRYYTDRIVRFQRSGHWEIRYHNGGLAGLVCTLGDEVLLIVNDPSGLGDLTQLVGKHQPTVLNLGTVPVAVSPGVTVAPAAAYPAADEPVLKIAVMSDVQGMPYAEDAGMRNLERALDVFAALKPDVVVNAGDINDSGNDADAVRYYKARCDARLGKLPHVACLGNHEIGFVREENREARTRDACLADFNAVFGDGPSAVVRRMVGGYDFISLAVATTESYAAADVAALKAALDAAVARDATKPIFVVTHFHPLDTVNSSGSERNDSGLRALLNGYPQVVNLSGHTHNPLQDPRSIWQGEFTAIDTSTLCYGCLDLRPPAANQISCLVPYGHESVGCLFVEVYADRMVVRRFSVRDRREIEPDRPWTFALPYDPKNPTYSFAARAATETVPDFGADAEPTLWYDYGYVYLMFNAVRPLGSVFGYRIELTEDGGETKSYFHVSDYYRLPDHRQDRVVFRAPPQALQAGRHYRCRIVPVGFFGKEGGSVEWAFDIRRDYPCRTDKPNALPE